MYPPLSSKGYVDALGGLPYRCYLAHVVFPDMDIKWTDKYTWEPTIRVKVSLEPDLVEHT